MRITIKVDANDADYQELTSKITREELNKIRPLIKKIKKFKPYKGISKEYKLEYTHHHNYPTGEVCRPDLGEKSVQELYPDITEDVFEIFNEYCPYCEHGFHTIKSIEVFPNTTIEKLL